MGAPMKLTVGMAILFRHAVLGLRNSPYDARMMVKEAMPDRDVPCHTGAYASYEKGAVENCNRLVRRWYPKGTDFNRLTRRQIRQLEDWINSIHRESLNGETAYAYDSRLAKVA